MAKRCMALQDVTKTIFDERVGESFTLDAGQGPAVGLQLDFGPGTQRSGCPRGKPVRESFSAIWCAPHSCRLPQRIYRLSHPKLEPLDIFLVPIGPDPEGRGMRMEAVFNFSS